MSVILMEEKQIVTIVKTLQSFDYSGNGGRYALYQNVVHMADNELTRLFRKMYINNHKSYRERYKDLKSGFIKLSFNKKVNVLSCVQLIKAMECFLYNCDIKCDSTKQFKAILEELKTVYIHSLTDYNAATWR